jgi:membrane associated rhomboid family serine protease
MSTLSRRELALQILSKTGMQVSNYSPPAVRLLWRMGIDCPPPHFARFWPVFFISGVYFGVMLGLFMWLATLYRPLFLLSSVPFGAAIAGCCFGFFMASYYAIGRWKYQLPRREEIGVASGN